MTAARANALAGRFALTVQRSYPTSTGGYTLLVCSQGGVSRAKQGRTLGVGCAYAVKVHKSGDMLNWRVETVNDEHSGHLPTDTRVLPAARRFMWTLGVAQCMDHLFRKGVSPLEVADVLCSSLALPKMSAT